ncbi:MAG: DUF4166 domain-containing protein [Sulfitobacter sp.]
MKVLILGGYGVFGGRLAELLSDLPGLDLLIRGRNLERATAFSTAYQGEATARPVQLDRRDIAGALARETPDLVVDASGPFQEYGTDGYLVITSCIEAGIDYVDFADAADFVFGISRFDAAAQAAGVFILSGVSSFPVLTAAVLRDVAERMDIVSVAGGIAPSPFAGVGLNVMRAVVGYAGSPIKLMRGGTQQTASGLAESMRYTVAVPGYLPLRNIHFSLVEVPDLQVIPPEHATLRDIWMGAGPVPESLHRVLNLLAKARARFSLPALTPFSRLFYGVLNLMKFGEHRGGMFVHVNGRKEGRDVEESWHLLAEGNDGPYIPSMAIEAIIRKLMNGSRPENGARPATRALALADYDRLFEGRDIYAGFRRDSDPPVSVYSDVLGSSFAQLPARVQELHTPQGDSRWAGKADVSRGNGLLVNLICRVFRFPEAAKGLPVEVDIRPVADGEKWTRNFGGKMFSSFHSRGNKRDAHLVVERFGPVAVSLGLVVTEGCLSMVARRWTCFGIAMPSMLLPGGYGYETQRGDSFCFDVEISAPLVGKIVAYKGTLRPQEISL